MATDRVKVLNACLRTIAKPVLSDRGFTFDGARTFRRAAEPCTQIINFQVGVRSMEGQFTVNLGVFHPEYSAVALYHGPIPESPSEADCVVRQRLGGLRETLLTKFLQPRIKNRQSFLAFWLTTPTDKWWPFTDNEAQVSRELQRVLQLLQAKGLPWLERNSDVALLKTEYSKLRPLPPKHGIETNPC